MKKRSYIKYFAALLLFGSNGIVASGIAMTSYEIVFWRTMIGSVLLIALFLITGNRFSFWKQPKSAVCLLVSGIAMGVSWMFLYEAYRRIGVGVASLLYYCGPVIVMIFSPLLFRERLTAPKLAGFAIVAAGVVLLNGRMSGGMDRVGFLCGAMSAVMYFFMVVFNKKAAGIPGTENSTLQLTVSFLTVAAFVLIRQGLAVSVPRGDILRIVFLGLVNTGIGCWFYFSSIGDLPVQTVAICGYLEPLSAVLLSVTLLGERMTAAQAVGAAMILGGAALGELVKPRAKERNGCNDIGNDV